MKFPFFASFVIFILVLQHNIRKGKRTSEQAEAEFWKRESSANDVRRQSLEDLPYITFKAEPFFPVNLLDAADCPEFLSSNPDVKEILSRFLFLEQQKIVNLNEYTNTDLKFKYGVANLPSLTDMDSNYNELITLLHNYGNTFANAGYEDQAITIWEYAVSIGTDISSTYLLLAKIYQETSQWNKIDQLKKEAEIISTSRKDSIVRKLQEFGPCNG